MPDTTPVANQININLSLLLEDAVYDADNGLAAALDGVIYTGVKRNKYVAEAERELVLTLTNRLGYEKATEALQGAMVSTTITTSSSGASVPKNFICPSKLTFSNIDAQYVLTKSKLDQDLDPYLNYGYTISGGKIYFYKRVAGVMTISDAESATFLYFGVQRTDSTTGSDVSVNTAPDIAIDARWNDFLTLYAAARASFDSVSAIADPDPTMVEKGNRFMAMAMEKLPRG